MSSAVIPSIGLLVSDVSGQRRVRAKVPSDATVDEMVRELVPAFPLPTEGVDGEPVQYVARHHREQRHLLPGEVISHVLQEGDEIALVREVTAGCGR
jgi:hypothetical protein